MSEWITHRRPTFEDAKEVSPVASLFGPRYYVWVTREDDKVSQMAYQAVNDEPWMPITPPKPYVKPKRFRVEQTALDGRECFAIYDDGNDLRCSFYLPTHQAAERIAAIYEEVMP